MSKPVFEDLVTFSGRRNRRSYLLYCLCTIPVYVLILFLLTPLKSAIMVSAPEAGEVVQEARTSILFQTVALMLYLPLLLSAFAVMSQRCRDIGWSGYAALLTLIPVAGIGVGLAFLFKRGQTGPNRFGEDPLALLD